MAVDTEQVFDLTQDTNDPNVYLYDPRPRRRSHGRRRRRRMSLYDPQPRRRTRLRRAFGRVYRRGRTRRTKSPMGKLWTGINHIAPWAVGLFAFFSTAKVFADYTNQINTASLGKANIGQKIQWFLGMTIYRVGAAFGQNWQIATGTYYNFPSQSTVGFGFKPWGAFNNVTIGAGIVLLLVHFFPGLPRAGLVRKTAWFALIGGAIGGSIDPTGGKPTGSQLAPATPTYPQAGIAYAAPAPAQGRVGNGGLPY